MISYKNIKDLVDKGEVYSDYPDFRNHKRRILKDSIEIEFSFGKRVRVEKGFNWDETTVPWIFEWAFPKSGKFAYAALPHDVAYYGEFCTRKQADKEYLIFSKLLFGSKVKAYLRYFLVRLIGWYYWNRTSYIGKENLKLIKIIE